MNSLIIFKSALVNTLQSSIRMNLRRYLMEDAWIAEVSTAANRDMPTGVELSESAFIRRFAVSRRCKLATLGCGPDSRTWSSGLT
jgi:hypothetical protein